MIGKDGGREEEDGGVGGEFARSAPCWPDPPMNFLSKTRRNHTALHIQQFPLLKHVNHST